MSDLDKRIDIGVSWYLDMFSMLETSRGANNYISLSCILDLANNFELLGSKQQFVSIIQALDDVYVEFNRKQDERRNKSKS